MKIKNVVLDFDGTCTQIPLIYQQYLDHFLEELNKRIFPVNQYSLESNAVNLKEWGNAQIFVRKHSPKAGWTLAYTSSAPAAADPYILAHESAKYILRNRRRGIKEVDLPFELHSNSNEANEAPWRPEAKEVIELLLEKEVNVFFISNSSSAMITRRLKELLEVKVLPSTLQVQSDANKFRISELPLVDKSVSLPAKAIAAFDSLPVVHKINADGRPVFIRRFEYFRAICAVLNNDLRRLNETVFCGDIWEMDLAMPSELGGNIHLITRASPFTTYPYEISAVIASQGKISDDLRGLLDWF